MKLKKTSKAIHIYRPYSAVGFILMFVLLLVPVALAYLAFVFFLTPLVDNIIFAGAINIFAIISTPIVAPILTYKGCKSQELHNIITFRKSGLHLNTIGRHTRRPRKFFVWYNVVKFDLDNQCVELQNQFNSIPLARRIELSNSEKAEIEKFCGVPVFSGIDRNKIVRG
ncbi:MAG: hypothetical protein FWG64_10480 [Firmicutes bacterium]|nr:hypothetical protein [Bacillota bacterium]